MTFAPRSPTLRAGTILEYDAALKELFPGTTTPFGLLADDTGGGATPVMCYRKGTFLRGQIEAANGVEIAPGSAIDAALSDIGIHFAAGYQ